MFQNLIDELSTLPQIEAIALGGSRAGEHFDASSDYDVYLYCSHAIPESTRREILRKYCSYMELGNHFWELEDNCTLKNGVDIDILYRDLEDFTRCVAAVVEEYQACNGYTTCMWHNLNTCRILYDRDGRLAAARERFAVPYPAPLKNAIVSRNLKLLHGTLPAYDSQITKAASRGDLVSINHRVSAFLESYFDLLFALNAQTHPGEKRLVPLAKECCPLLPQDFEANLELLFSHMFTAPDQIRQDLTVILHNLEMIL